MFGCGCYKRLNKAVQYYNYISLQYIALFIRKIVTRYCIAYLPCPNSTVPKKKAIGINSLKFTIKTELAKSANIDV